MDKNRTHILRLEVKMLSSVVFKPKVEFISLCITYPMSAVSKSILGLKIRLGINLAWVRVRSLIFEESEMNAQMMVRFYNMYKRYGYYAMRMHMVNHGWALSDVARMLVVILYL